MPGVAGRSGRKPKSISDHHRDGTFRPHRHAQRADLVVASVELPCPFDAGSEAYNAWNRIVDNLPADYITEMDHDLLVIYCELWQAFCEVWPKFREDPLNKDIRIAAMALVDRLRSVGAVFGCGPLSRLSLRLPVADSSVADDPLTLFLARKRKDG